jgi:hypothetical protein
VNLHACNAVKEGYQFHMNGCCMFLTHNISESLGLLTICFINGFKIRIALLENKFV